jgi:hypothetical protein
MITLDVFNNDAFSVVTMIDPVNKMPTLPGFLGSLGIFDPEPVSTDSVGIGMKEGQLAIIQTTLRGSPIEMAEPEVKNARNFTIPRIAKGDQIRASQLANIVPDIGSTEVQTVANLLAAKQQRLKQDVEYTWERHRLGAIQGILLDADDTEIYDFYDEWDVSQPAEIDLDLETAADGELRLELTGIKRTLVRAAGGVGISRVIGLAGDNFWDQLVKNPEVRESYLGWSAAAELRSAEPFSTFRYGGIDWINYQGSDDTTTIAIDTDDAVIIPVGVPGMFRHIKGPGETFETVNRMGRDVYPLIVRDKDRDMWVQPEIYSYPLFINTRPDLVLRATVGA